MAEAKKAKAAQDPDARTESFEAERPDGSLVRVDRNLDTGEQTLTEIDK